MRTKPPLPYLHIFKDRFGVKRTYFRRPGYKSVPLPGPLFSPAFMAAYQSAMADEPLAGKPVGAARTLPGTVNAAIVGYYGDQSFTSLAQGTQKSRRAILERFRADYGERRISTLPADKLAAFIRAKKPFAARGWLKTMRGLMRYCVAVG